MTRDTGTDRTSYRYAVDESKSKSQTKRSAVASGHLKDYMDSIHHSARKWEDLKHDDMTNKFWGGGWNLYR